MSERNLRIRWAHKLLKAKSFVVLTDKESIIALKGVNPNKLTDVLSLQEQAASLDNFLQQLKALQEEHEHAIETIMEARNETPQQAKATGGRKKIKVKED